MQFKLTLLVERMSDELRSNSTVFVQVKVTFLASVPRTYTSFFAPFAIEWDFSVVEFEFVMAMNWMRNFLVNLGYSVG